MAGQIFHEETRPRDSAVSLAYEADAVLLDLTPDPATTLIDIAEALAAALTTGVFVCLLFQMGDLIDMTALMQRLPTGPVAVLFDASPFVLFGVACWALLPQDGSPSRIQPGRSERRGLTMRPPVPGIQEEEP